MARERSEAAVDASTEELQSEMVSVLPRLEQETEHHVSNNLASIVNQMKSEVEHAVNLQSSNIVLEAERAIRQREMHRRTSSARY